ncbi:VOC family protein [Sphingomonas montanisoli]|uniref:VOC family protein n=1 Tax=Sphingomonas montanisoli TaxID=2606412 RepID=A0A5D9C176_9SPHN|nr:VOC family protein [Sphingomonas montanisoli]TZG24947.1 VOC family protein [Sphingomonas montanisoli]
MITHFMVGANDVEKSRAFYDAALSAIGYPKSNPAIPRAIYKAEGAPSFMVGKPENGEDATFANGGTIGFNGGTKAQVDAFHAAGLANGGTCAGAPGPRPALPNMYGAYLRDPDGNKIAAFSFDAA